MTSDKADPPAFDTSVAHQARMYDYMLGGKDNYAADRAATEAAVKVWPDMAAAARANRAFLGRAVRYLAGEAVVLAHARALLTSSEAGVTEYIEADLRSTGTILTQAAQVLDFTKPVAVTLIFILHAIPDADDPYAIVARLLDAVPPGSHLAISHAGADLLDRKTLQGIQDAWRGRMQQQITWRTREQVARFFAGTDLVAPGLVRVEEWRPDPGGSARTAAWCAVGRKR